MEELLQLLIYLIIFIVAILLNAYAKKTKHIPPPDENIPNDEEGLDIIFEEIPEKTTETQTVEELKNDTNIPQQKEQYKQENKTEHSIKESTETKKDMFLAGQKIYTKPLIEKDIYKDREKILQMIVGQIIFSKPKCKTTPKLRR